MLKILGARGRGEGQYVFLHVRKVFAALHSHRDQRFIQPYFG